MKNAIVIPSYNEAERLDFNKFNDFLLENPDYLVCFVNDGSKDNTLALIQNFCTKYKNATVYDMPQNGGKAEAVRSGVNYVIENFSVDQIGFMDADLSTSFKEYKRLSQKLEANSDLKIVFGSRQEGEDSNIERTLFRDIASKSVSLLIRSILRLPIHDTQCGAKIFRTQTARYCFKDSFITRWLFDVEIFVKMKELYSNKVMNNMLEVPLTEWIHVDGSKISLKDSLQIPKMLALIIYNYKAVPVISEYNRKFRMAFKLNTESQVQN